MRNRYIEQYENTKILNEGNYIFATRAILRQLIIDEEKYLKKQQAPKTSPLKLFTEAPTGKLLQNELKVMIEEIDEFEKELDTTKDYRTRETSEHFFSVFTSLKELIKNQNSTYDALFDYILKDIAELHDQTREAILEKSESSQLGRVKFNELLKSKHLQENLFSPQYATVTTSDPLDSHVNWAFNYIYKIPYPNTRAIPEHQPIARYHHGIQHVTRAALFASVFANLYRRYDDPEALKLTDEDIKLIQIALLFHDSARMNEEEDKWDHESAILLYGYLTKILNINEEQAKLLAEAVANKDPHPDGYFTIVEANTDSLVWTRRKDVDAPKNIYQKIIHDADCLDIIRACDAFFSNYLDFYKDIVTKHRHSLDELFALRLEATSLIEIQGDTRRATRTETKMRYEHHAAYQRMSEDLRYYPLLSALTNGLIPSPVIKDIVLYKKQTFDPNKPLTEENIRAALKEGILARGIPNPSAISPKPLKTGAEESLAALELRKSLRRKGVQTTSSKADAFEKEGNPNRSVAMIGFGHPPYAPAGYLIVPPQIDDIIQVSAMDFDTGGGKKENIKMSRPTLSHTEKQKQFDALKDTLKMGGALRSYYRDALAKHAEILYDIKDYSAVYYTNDPVSANFVSHQNMLPLHPHSSLLQAIYLQREYFLQNKRLLPIFNYTSVHNAITEVPPKDLTDDHIVALWVEMAGDFIQKELAKPNSSIFTLSIDEIKVLSMYGQKDYQYAKRNAPADSNYSDELKAKVMSAIKEKQEKLFQQYEFPLIKKLATNELSLLDDEIFFMLARNPRLRTTLQTFIMRQLYTIPRMVPPTEQLFQNSLLLDANPSIFSEDFYPDNYSKLLALYDSKFCRLYKFAKLMNATDILHGLQDKLAQQFLNDIHVQSERLRQHLPFKYMLGYQYEPLKYIVQGASLFDLVPRIKDQMIQFSSAYLQEMLNDKGLIHHLDSFNQFIHYLFANNLMNQAMQTQLQNKVQSLKTELDRLPLEGLASYFQLSDLSQCPSTHKKEILVQWFQMNPAFYFTDFKVSILKMLNDHVPLYENEMFRLVSSKCKYRVESEYDRKVSPPLWLTSIMILKNEHPNKTFTAEQLSILEERFDAICQEYANEVSDSKALNLPAFIQMMDGIHAQSIAIKIPTSLSKLFNQLLNGIDLSSLTETQIEKIQKLHAKLDFAQDREDAIANLSKPHTFSLKP